MNRQLVRKFVVGVGVSFLILIGVHGSVAAQEASLICADHSLPTLQEKMSEFIKSMNDMSFAVLGDRPYLISSNSMVKSMEKVAQELVKIYPDPVIQQFVLDLGRFAGNSLTLPQLAVSLWKVKNRLLETIPGKFPSFLPRLMSFRPLLKTGRFGPPVAADILASLELIPFNPKVVGETAFGGKVGIKQEIYGDLRKTDFSLINEIIDDVRGFGGQVVLLRGRDPDSEKLYDNINFFFTVSPLGVPQIAFNPLKNYALAGLLHEYHHFKNWKNKVKELWSKDPTLSWVEVGKKAKNYFHEKENIVEDERGAILAEEQAEREYPGHKYNRGPLARPVKGQDIYYYLSLFYPGNEAIRKEMGAAKWNNRPVDMAFIHKVLRENRQLAAQGLQEMETYYRSKMEKGASEKNDLEYESAKNYLLYLKNLNIFEFIFMDEKNRFIQDRFYEELFRIWKELPPV